MPCYTVLRVRVRVLGVCVCVFGSCVCADSRTNKCLMYLLSYLATGLLGYWVTQLAS